jgi:hypothetical protein
MLEGDSALLGRHYALIYNETPGVYTQRFPAAPDGDWFIDDVVSDQRLGVYTGKELRSKGMPVAYYDGYSPLKVYRFIPAAKVQADWVSKYRTP